MNENYKPIPSMGLVHLPTWMVDLYAFHVGKYTMTGMVYGITWILPPKSPKKIVDSHEG